MSAKDVKFGDSARSQMLDGVNNKLVLLAKFQISLLINLPTQNIYKDENNE